MRQEFFRAPTLRSVIEEFLEASPVAKDVMPPISWLQVYLRRPAGRSELTRIVAFGSDVYIPSKLGSARKRTVRSILSARSKGHRASARPNPYRARSLAASTAARVASSLTFTVPVPLTSVSR
jgi:hypothetical protein